MPHVINYNASGQIASRHITLLSSRVLSDSSYEFKCLSSVPEKQAFCHSDPPGRTFWFRHSPAFYPLCHSRKDQPFSCPRIFSVHVFVKGKLRIRSPINAKASTWRSHHLKLSCFMFFSYPIEEWRITTSRVIIQEFRYSASWVATVAGGVGTVLDGAEVATEKSTKKEGILNDEFHNCVWNSSFLTSNQPFIRFSLL